MQIKPCKTDEEIRGVFPVVAQIYRELNEDLFLQYVREMERESSYMLVGVFGEGDCIGIVGLRSGRRFYCGRYIQIDNMIIRKAHRSKGVGKALMDWIREEASRQGAAAILADTYTENYGGQRFYLREGFVIRGFHLKLDV